MTSESSVPDPVRIGLGTAVKWRELKEKEGDGALRSAVRARNRGGSINPHLSVFQLITALVSGRLTLAECKAKIAALPTQALREDRSGALNHFLDYLGSTPWDPLRLTGAASMIGPKGILEAGTRAHFAFRRQGRTHWGLIWNNKSPRLGKAAACLGGALMRRAVEANDNDLFETIDVRNGEVFSITTEEIDSNYDKVSGDFAQLEDDYVRLSRLS